MPERSWSQPEASTQEYRTDAAIPDTDALRAELGAFLYRVVSYPEETEPPEAAEERMDESILAGVL
jgi:hypothetical protein